jgi:hypothetical protein
VFAWKNSACPALYPTFVGYANELNSCLMLPRINAIGTIKNSNCIPLNLLSGAEEIRMAELQNGVWFSIDIEDEEFIAFISTEALSATFHVDEKKPPKLRSSYSVQREMINAVAKRKFLSGSLRPIEDRCARSNSLPRILLNKAQCLASTVYRLQ